MSQTIFVVMCLIENSHLAPADTVLVSSHSLREAACKARDEHTESKEHEEYCGYYHGWTTVRDIELVD